MNTNNNKPDDSKVILMLGGIITILISVILEDSIAPLANNITILKSIIIILSKCLSAVGVALAISYITNRFQNNEEDNQKRLDIAHKIYEQEFHPKITNSLNDFINNPNTISLLNDDTKKNLMTKLISTEDHTLNIFKEKHIYDLFGNDNSYRSNGSFTAQAYLKNKDVYLESTIKYKLHIDKLSVETISYNDSKTIVEYIKFINPNNVNDYKTIKKEDLKSQAMKAYGNSLEFKIDIHIPEEYKNFNELIVERKMIFIGDDHWINIGWLNYLPTHGFSVSIRTRNNLIVKEWIFFETNNLYSVAISEDKTDFDASTDQWVEKNSGFDIIIGMP